MGNLFAEKLELCVSEQVEQGLDKVNTKEMGEAVDMIKDSYEIDMLKSKKKYYDKIVEAMEESEYGEDYDWEGRMGYPRRRNADGTFRSNRRGNRMGYPDYRMHPEEWEDMGYSTSTPMSSGNMRSRGAMGNSRYGYSHDEYMENRKEADPEKRKQLLNDYMDDMYDMAKDMIEDMSSEEKQMWKSKLARIVNM